MDLLATGDTQRVSSAVSAFLAGLRKSADP